MRILCLVQARMSSGRMHGKILRELCGAPMIVHLLNSLSHSKTISETVVATTASKNDDVLVDLLERRGDPYYRGSEDDVLSRYAGAMRRYGADYVVRITADNPLTDPEIVDATVGLATATARGRRRCDYASNHIVKTYPLGYVVEVISAGALAAVEAAAQTGADREHVTWYLLRNLAKFETRNLLAPGHLTHPDWRLTVDTAEDFEMMRHVFDALYVRGAFIRYQDVARLLVERPDLLKINSHIKQKSPRGRAG